MSVKRWRRTALPGVPVKEKYRDTHIIDHTDKEMNSAAKTGACLLPFFIFSSRDSDIIFFGSAQVRVVYMGLDWDKE